MATPLPCVCLCVDDFGLHEAINRAVFALAAACRLGATGVMVDGPAWRGGAPGLRSMAPHALDVGLHLDLTEPQAAGRKFPLKQLIVASYAGQLDGAWLVQDIHRQLDAFETAMQRPPAFVDGHQHVHQLPQVRDALVQVLEQRYAPAPLPWLRNTRPRHWAGAGMRNGFKARLIAALGSRGLMTLARQHGFAANPALAGVYGFEGDGMRYQQLLRAWITQARHGDVVMCHPAVDVVAGDPIATARCVEHQVLVSDWFGALVQEAGISLGPLSRWLQPSGG